jgi:drug/metabolite transporter (DMT)-like permease
MNATETRQEAVVKPTTQAQSSSRLRYDLVLVLVTMIWGSTFLVTKYAIQYTGPFVYLGICYTIGTVTLAFVFRKHLRHITRSDLKYGAVLGLCLCTGYALQTTGLQYTPVSKAGFITGLYVPLVPLLSLFILRQRPAFGAVIGIVLSVIGLTLLSVNRQFDFSLGIGGFLLLGCAFAFALHIVCINKFGPRADPTNLSIVQLAVTALLSFALVPFAGKAPALASVPLLVWGAMLFMGIADIAFTLLMMVRIQQYIGGVRATLIYALEPVWAAVFGYLLGGDRLSILAFLGCGCILLGMIAGRLWQRN